LISVATLQVNAVVTGIIANGLQSGSISALQYAFPIMTVPLVIIGSGIGIATLPTFSAQTARGEFGALSNSLAGALRGVLLLSIPATLGLILLRQPLIAMLFQHGNFTSDSTLMTSWVLLWYSVGLVGHCVLEILVRAFFALHDTKTPAFVSAGAMGLNIVLCILFSVLFRRNGWLLLGGLAFSISLSTAIETTTLFILLRKRLGGIHGRDLAKGVGAAILGTLVMSIAILIWSQGMKDHSLVLITLGGVMLGTVVYAVVMVLLRIPEVGSLIQLAKRWLSNRNAAIR
jgi:putative peptidoglycan lipid II flippase